MGSIIGCYAGYLYDWLAPKPKHYLGLDILPEAVEAAKALHPEVDFMAGNLFNLGKLGLRADLVLCSRVLIHLPKFEQAVKVLCEAAKKYCVMILAVGERNTCDRVDNGRAIYYFRRFKLSTIRTVCEPYGAINIVCRSNYATVVIRRD